MSIWPEVNRLQKENAKLRAVIYELELREREVVSLLNAARADMQSTSRILTKKLDELRRD